MTNVSSLPLTALVSLAYPFQLLCQEGGEEEEEEGGGECRTVCKSQDVSLSPGIF